MCAMATVTIAWPWLAALFIYACIATALALCILAGSGRECESLTAANSALRVELHELPKLQLAKNAEIAQLKADKDLLAKRYLDAYNEYSWFRIMIREAMPDVSAAAEQEILKQKKVMGRDLPPAPVGETCNG